ncbi:LacI family DNA-binding transcriptional regulator [Bifidobacterium sp. SO1]|uniref:LacI family DNA-binding transcriptional regulator n=1 Tax=Bifidobacterium sp. SO1 TaxID=2809029 RepID=UPI001BDC14E0|nr:LacI family DNA-binding transcriptional regulator [Bifidobacterium sp. SO1]MBT1160603.1 LacI family DNA-binding transcriptional regulator [Bifidobacterium sp. SO1]
MVTMRDVAAKVGVSQATVSYALRGDPSISEKTRRKVLDAARELNYSTNLSARSLKSGRSGAIGLVLQDLGNPYSVCVADSFSKYALKHDMQIVIQQTLYSQENETSILEHVTSAFCDAVIFSPTIISSSRIKQQLAGKPAVLLSPSDAAPELDAIVTPCQEGAFTAASYLLSTGCRRLLFLGKSFEPYEVTSVSPNTGVQRMAGFQQALLRNGLPLEPERFVDSKWNSYDGRWAIENAIERGIEFDGIVCANDALALGALRGVQDHGLRIPDDVSVIGFDGVVEATTSNPSLSTIAFDFDDMAKQAIDTILAQLNDDDADGDGQTVSPSASAADNARAGGSSAASAAMPKRLIAKYRLVVRESTR